MKKQVYVISVNRAFGGGEIYQIRLAELMQLASQFSIVSPESSALQRGLEACGGHFVSLPGNSGAALRLAMLQWCWRQRGKLRENAAALVLNGRGAAYFAPLIRAAAGLAPVVICHTELTMKRHDVKEWLYGLSLKFARCSIAVSETVAEQHRRRWPGLRVHAIPNWIDHAGSTHLPAIVPVSLVMDIAVVGRLETAKGVLDVTAAGSTLDDIVVHFYGDGPLRGELEKLALHRTWVKVHGHIDDLNMRLAQHAILVSGSHSESFSYAVAEAIHAGLLCVVSDIPAHRELLGPAYPDCLYFLPGDVNALACALGSARILLSDGGGSGARHAVMHAYARMRIRNGPEQARANYQRVLLGIPSNAEGAADR